MVNQSKSIIVAVMAVVFATALITTGFSSAVFAQQSIHQHNHAHVHSSVVSGSGAVSNSGNVQISQSNTNSGSNVETHN